MSARHRAAEAMSKAGVNKLPRWGKARQIGCASVQPKLTHGECGAHLCGKPASYSTPKGKRCFAHAAEIVEPPAWNRRAALGKESGE